MIKGLCFSLFFTENSPSQLVKHTPQGPWQVLARQSGRFAPGVPQAPGPSFSALWGHGRSTVWRHLQGRASRRRCEQVPDLFPAYWDINQVVQHTFHKVLGCSERAVRIRLSLKRWRSRSFRCMESMKQRCTSSFITPEKCVRRPTSAGRGTPSTPCRRTEVRSQLWFLVRAAPPPRGGHIVFKDSEDEGEKEIEPDCPNWREGALIRRRLMSKLLWRKLWPSWVNLHKGRDLAPASVSPSSGLLEIHPPS